MSFFLVGQAERGSACSYFDVPDSVFLIDRDDRDRARVLRTTHQQIANVGGGLADYRGRAGLEDSRLLTSDGVKRIAEQIGVVETDRCNRGHFGRKNVGRIQPPAEPCFDDADIRVVLGEPMERERRRYLEEGRAQFFGEWDPASEKLEYFGLGDWAAIDSDPLAKIDQVWGCVFADPVSAGPQQCFARRDNAPLAVGSRDMNRGQVAVGRSHLGEERFRSREAWFDTAGGAGEESLDRLAVARQEVVHPAEAGLPLMCRSSWPTVLLRSERDTTESTMPCSSRNSAVWNPSGSS